MIFLIHMSVLPPTANGIHEKALGFLFFLSFFLCREN
jgi:hypothetical protein